MTSFYDVGALLLKEYKEKSPWKYENTYSEEPYYSLKKRIDTLLAGNPLVIGAPGVPGAGKTTFYAYILAKHLKDIICNEIYKHRYLYVYIAPTNDLVRDFFEKFVKFLKGVLGIKCDPAVLSRRLRVYGSKIMAPSFPKLLKAIDEDVVLVASTDWQRVSARILTSKEQFYFIDEASRMTFVRLFIPIADAIARGESRGEIKGFAVIGDENQAVGLTEEERRLLLLHSIRKLYEDSRNHVYVVPLTVSWRLPKETAEPIKIGFYDGNLEGRGTPLKIPNEHEQIKRILAEIKGICRKYISYIEQFLGIASEQPLVHLELSEHFQKGDRYDIGRAKLSWCLAYVVSHLTNKKIAVVTPYTKMAFAIRMLGEIPNVSTTTVASYLGRENNIIIATFGKEQAGSCNTYYMQDPFSFNVQLSRQLNALYTIGSAEMLRVSTEYCKAEISREKWKTDAIVGIEKMRRTVETLLSMEHVVLKI